TKLSEILRRPRDPGEEVLLGNVLGCGSGAVLGSQVGGGWMGLQSGQKLAINGVIADFGAETLRTYSGNSIELRPQAFAVLRHLAEHAGQVVMKNELMRAVWPGIAVTDDSL